MVKQLKSLGPWFESGWPDFFLFAEHPPQKKKKKNSSVPSDKLPSFQHELSGLLSFDCSRQDADGCSVSGLTRSTPYYHPRQLNPPISCRW